MTPSRAESVETYLREQREIRYSGEAVGEISGYGTLANLFNAIGKNLKPKVRCIIQLKNRGAGMPDGGFFTPDQLINRNEDLPLLGQQPARGVIEVKSTADEVDATATTEQVGKYLRRYGQVLVTNYRDFLLLKRGHNGRIDRLESFRLAASEAAFWSVTAHPRKVGTELGE